MKETTLDPENWDEYRKLSHHALDMMIDHLKNIRNNKVWQPMSEDIKQAFRVPIPQNPESYSEIIEDFKRLVYPYSLGNTHPRFWGWVVGTGTPFQVIASILASGLNSPGGSFEQVTTYMELQIIEWMKEVFHFPSEASGLLVSGGSMANYIGLAVARQVKLKFNIREEGFQQSKEYYTLYTSTEAHFSVTKVIEALGFGSNALRKIKTNDDYTINIESLENQIRKDKEQGRIPICIIGTVGTVNTGAIDDIEKIAEICARENLWLHIDGAFGALLALSPIHQEKVKNIAKADSLAFDFHKWMHINYEGACALIKNHQFHRDTFALIAHYTRSFDRGVASAEIMFSDYGLELSREFKALKIWMSIKEYGIRKLGSQIEQNIAQAQYLAQLINNRPELELIAPVSMNIICFRYKRESLTDEELNPVNQEILTRLQEEGIAVPSSTVLQGKFVIRVSITNHRTINEDLELLVDETIRLGNKV